MRKHCVAVTWHICKCGKRGYTSKRSALMANTTNGARLRAYQCGAGACYHVTAAEKRERRYLPDGEEP